MNAEDRQRAQRHRVAAKYRRLRFKPQRCAWWNELICRLQQKCQAADPASPVPAVSAETLTSTLERP